MQSPSVWFEMSYINSHVIDRQCPAPTDIMTGQEAVYNPNNEDGANVVDEGKHWAIQCARGQWLDKAYVSNQLSRLD